MSTNNIFDFLKRIPGFDGKPEELPLFIQSIEELRQYVEDPIITLFDLQIRHKILNEANIALINNNSPTNWEEIKKVLKSNFSITESIESLVNQIKTSEMKNSIENMYEHLVHLLTKLNLRASVEENCEWYTCANNEIMVLKIFINKLPNEPKLILNARNPSSLSKAKEILIETDYFYKNSTLRNGQSLSSQNNVNLYNKKYISNPKLNYNRFTHQEESLQNFNRNNPLSQRNSYLRHDISTQNRNNFQNIYSSQNNNKNTQNNMSDGIPNNNRQFQNFSPSMNISRSIRQYQNPNHFSRNFAYNNNNQRSFPRYDNNSANRRYSRNYTDDSQIPMDIGIVEQQNFQSPAEDLYPI